MPHTTLTEVLCQSRIVKMPKRGKVHASRVLWPVHTVYFPNPENALIPEARQVPYPEAMKFPVCGAAYP